MVQSIVASAFISFGKRINTGSQESGGYIWRSPWPVQEVVVVVGSLVGRLMGVMLSAMPASFGALVSFPGKLIALATSINLVKVQTVINLTVAQKAAAAGSVSLSMLP